MSAPSFPSSSSPDRFPVRASTLSADHALGSPQPWVSGSSPAALFRGPAPFHPTADGMHAVTGAVLDAVTATRPG